MAPKKRANGSSGSTSSTASSSAGNLRASKRIRGQDPAEGQGQGQGQGVSTVPPTSSNANKANKPKPSTSKPKSEAKENKAQTGKQKAKPTSKSSKGQTQDNPISVDDSSSPPPPQPPAASTSTSSSSSSSASPSKSSTSKVKSHSGPKPSAPTPGIKKVTKVEKEGKALGELDALEAWNHYKEEEPVDEQGNKSAREVITMEGYEKLFSDLNISFEGLKPIIFAYLCSQQCMGASLTQSEFESGFSVLESRRASVYGLSGPGYKLKLRDLSECLEREQEQVLQGMEIPIENPSEFKAFYRWLFGFVKGNAPGSKVLLPEAATTFWALTLQTRWPLVELFNQFLMQRNERLNGKGCAVNMDIWKSLHELCQSIETDGSGYDENASWPSLFDEFVEFLRERPQEERALSQEV